jgi:hypothetical protein
MIPHERSLVQQHKDKPFALVGVNSDPDLDKYRELAKQDGVTWRSFWDQTTDGPIATRWNVQGWPTIYLIDHEGVIRHRDIYGEEAISNAVAELVHAAEAAAKK